MRVVMLSKTFVADTAQRQLEWLARQSGVELTLVTPPSWRGDDGRVWPFTPRYAAGYDVRVLPIRLNGRYHAYTFRGLRRTLRELRPDLVHIDEEPYNLAGYQGQRAASALGAPTVFVAWQSQFRRYPPPWSWIERHDYRRTAYVISGNADVDAVIRRKGYTGPSAAFSVHGVDPETFAPRARPARDGNEIVVGYVGRLIFDKGLDVLIRALAHLPPRYRARLVGDGADREALRAIAEREGVADRVEFAGAVATVAVPDVMAGFDLFVLPSLTRPNWKEQFGRVLIEAMSSGVPVIGSDSGEIPAVIGEAGVIAREGDAAAWAGAIRSLGERPEERERYARLGREAVLERYTQERVARRIAAIYDEVLAGRGALRES